MDLFLADTSFKPYAMLSDIESFIWTERFSDLGDFELVIPSRYNITLDPLKPKYILAPFTSRVMKLETVETLGESSERFKLKLSGRAFESWLENGDLSYSPHPPKGIIGRSIQVGWKMSDLAQGYMNIFFGSSDFRVSNISRDTNQYSGGPTIPDVANYEQGNILELVTKTCKAADCGFKVVHNGNGGLLWSVYGSRDRTDPSNSLYRVYSHDVGNLTSAKTLYSVKGYKNTAKVVGDHITTYVYRDGIVRTGLARNMITVDATNVGTDTPEDKANDDLPLLKYLGYRELATYEHRNLVMLDADIIPNGANNSYILGDKVVVRDILGNQMIAIITEDIYSFENGALRRTPTFTFI